MTRQWYGGNDADTSPSYFACSPDTADHARFPELVAMLRRLAQDRYEVGDYSSPWVELIYLDDESPRKVIAFRFTSDIARRKWRPWLMEVAGCFGRGGWDPWRDRHQYRTLLGQQEGGR
jgi:hypothetical protein